MRAALVVIASLVTSRATAAPAKAPAAIVKQLDAAAAAMIDDTLTKVVPADAQIDLQHDLMEPAKITLAPPTFGWLGTCGWVAVEASIRTRTHPEMMAAGAPAIQPARPWHWLELVVPDGTGYAVKAMALAPTMPDSSLGDGVYNDVKELPAEPAPSVLVGWLAHPAEAAKHLSTDPAVTVYGTSAGDHAVGPAAASRLLASWSKLNLEVVTSKPPDTDNDHRELVFGDCAAVTARIRMKYQRGALLLHAFAIAHRVPDGWEIVALQYATDRTF